MVNDSEAFSQVFMYVKVIRYYVGICCCFSGLYPGNSKTPDGRFNGAERYKVPFAAEACNMVGVHRPFFACSVSGLAVADDEFFFIHERPGYRFPDVVFNKGVGFPYERIVVAKPRYIDPYLFGERVLYFIKYNCQFFIYRRVLIGRKRTVGYAHGKEVAFCDVDPGDVIVGLCKVISPLCVVIFNWRLQEVPHVIKVALYCFFRDLKVITKGTAGGIGQLRNFPVYLLKTVKLRLEFGHILPLLFNSMIFLVLYRR